VEICGRSRQVTDENIIRRMCFEFLITKATNTHSECVIIIFVYGKISFAMASQFYIYTYMASLVVSINLLS
jgi:hypothetical protein